MNGNDPLVSTAAADLLAKRWTEVRPLFTLNEGPRGGFLYAWWLRPHGRAGLEQRWSRLTPTRSLAQRWAHLDGLEGDRRAPLSRRASWAMDGSGA